MKKLILDIYAILNQEDVLGSSDKPLESMIALFKKKPCWTIETLSESLKYSVPSVRRFLASIGYLSSFSHNGAWYTLFDIPKFGRDGLWFYRHIGFSKAGSLTKTIVFLVNSSHEGMTASSLEEKLHSRCHSVLIGLCRKSKLRRFKFGRSHIYFSADPAICARQRKIAEARRLPEEPLPAEIAVLVLAEYIRNPKSDFQRLATSIARKGVYVNVSQIQKLFDQYDLKKNR